MLTEATNVGLRKSDSWTFSLEDVSWTLVDIERLFLLMMAPIRGYRGASVVLTASTVIIVSLIGILHLRDVKTQTSRPQDIGMLCTSYKCKVIKKKRENRYQYVFIFHFITNIS